MDLSERAARHSALGDERRLLIVDQLATGDRTVAELADLVGMTGNLLAHHLDVLDDAGLIKRRVSEGDQRRRYVSLRRDGLLVPTEQPRRAVGTVAFVCTQNSARSQFAAALWSQMKGTAASSAGNQPADRVHPTAIRIASEFGIDISRATPDGYDSLPADADLIISVCDRANEAGVPEAGTKLHWSVPDPVPVGTPTAFRTAFAEIVGRMESLAGAYST